MTTIILRALPYIGAVLLVVGALFGAYIHGVSVTDDRWQVRWNDRNTLDAKALAANETAQRAQEQAYQQSINKAVQNGQQIIDQAITDAVAARATADSLRGAADDLAAQLAASEASGNSCATAASKAAARAAMVLADVLKRADERSGNLADYADQSHGRGVTCEQMYDGISK
ncbi:DUF2514 domain-containing protein [Pseudomonas sp. S2_C03]